jgi:asparagine synthase (glutamine-hydrolysing)
MCSIVGTFVFDGQTQVVDPALLTRMRDTMVHRGPDGSGLWVSPDRKIGLAHRRLSIIDLSDAASQPMGNEDGSLWVSFNGEIYNHAEIRAELIKAGHHKWKTDHSDTEVILHAFAEWGINCLQRFRGMFAIALWDARNREMWLIRDRMGVKPLYYSVRDGKIHFASEIKALLQDPGQPRRVDEESFFHFLTFMTSPAPQTLFQGIRKLRNARYLRIKASGEISETQYWDALGNAPSLAGTSEDEICGRLLEILSEAVELRKVSDVPVGVFLSGGIDSSTNAALFSQGEKSKVKTFSIGYARDHPSYPSELPYARKMAEYLGAEHHELNLTMDDLIRFVPRMIHLQDEPIADPVCVPVYYVSKLARDHGAIVCQVGEGADELYWGYPLWKRLLRLQEMNNWPVPNFFKQGLLAGLSALGKDRRIEFEWLRRGVMKQPIFWGGAALLGEREKQFLMSPRLKGRFKDLTSWDALRPIHDSFLKNAREPSPLNWMSYLDLNQRLPELLLMRVDKMSMGVSLEGRVPFLDHKFVEFSMGIPSKMKTKNGELKHLLKKAVTPLLPEEIISRKKQGFGVPIHDWFMEKLGKEIEQVLRRLCKETDFMRWGAVESMIREKQSYSLWVLYNFALWHRLFIEQRSIEST